VTSVFCGVQTLSVRVAARAVSAGVDHDACVLRAAKCWRWQWAARHGGEQAAEKHQAYIMRSEIEGHQSQPQLVPAETE
jgi:hypothetical protein